MVTFDTSVTVPEQQVPVPPTTVTVPSRLVTASVDVDPMDLRTLLLMVGWAPDKVDVAQAVAQAESSTFSDAVGDITLVDAKWGPSIGLFQIRSLRYPLSFAGADMLRIAYALRNPWYNASAALAITNGGDWSKWSTFTNGDYRQYLGQSPKVRTGHANASQWWK
jgi:hypothetical protein